MQLGKIAAEQPHEAAVIMAGSGQTITFAELDAAANRLAHVLYDAGLRPGDHIAFMLENRWEFLAIAWAAQRSGLYYTPVSPRLQADECAYIIDDCGAQILFPPDAGSVYLSPAPLYHAAPLRYCLTMQRFGATVMLPEKFDPEQALTAIETYRVTHSQWVPTMLTPEACT